MLHVKNTIKYHLDEIHSCMSRTEEVQIDYAALKLYMYITLALEYSSMVQFDQ